MSTKPANDNDPEVAERLTNIEGLLVQLLREVRTKRRAGQKRAKTCHDRAWLEALAEKEYVPTELQRMAARRALQRARQKQQR
jgi:hypothetical protein